MQVVITDYGHSSLHVEKSVFEDYHMELIASQCKSEEDVIEACRTADGVINRYAPMSGRVIDALTRCKVIARYGIGVDTIDVDAASRRGIAVCNVTDYCIDEVADHTMALLLASVRKIGIWQDAVKRGEWNVSSGKPVHRMRGRVLGLLGFGRIPQQVSVRANAFGLKVIAYDPYISQSTADQWSVTLVDRETLWAESDVLSIHVPLTEDTRGMINTNVFERMKPGAVLVNTSRGPLVREEDLAEALFDGMIAGAALDVLEHEPPREHHPLFRMEQVIITPHVAFYSEESADELRYKAAMNVVHVLIGEKPPYLVNPAVYS